MQNNFNKKGKFQNVKKDRHTVLPRTSKEKKLAKYVCAGRDGATAAAAGGQGDSPKLLLLLLEEQSAVNRVHRHNVSIQVRPGVLIYELCSPSLYVQKKKR